MRSDHIPLLLLTGFLLTSCGAYRQNILFEVQPHQVQEQAAHAAGNYRIQPDDRLTLRVYTNRGEKIVDPNRESFRDGAAAPAAEATTVQYLVDRDGVAKFPLIEPVKVSGMTLRQAEEVLNEAYEKYYADAYVVLEFTNKRVIVLGAPGGQVIPLHHENMRLAEVIALAQGVNLDGRANNIRIIREDRVFLADFSTFAGYQKGNLVMQPGDIVYVEPVRRPFIEALRDYQPAISIVTSIATLIFIISQINP